MTKKARLTISRNKERAFKCDNSKEKVLILVLITELARTEHDTEPPTKMPSVHELSGIYQRDSYKATIKCVRLEMQVLSIYPLGYS